MKKLLSLAAALILTSGAFMASPARAAVPLPLTIDGKPASPDGITRYNGRPLYMAAMLDRGAAAELVAFTSPAEFEQFVRKNGGPANALAQPTKEMTEGPKGATGETSAGTTGPSINFTNSTAIYEHSHFRGNLLTTASGWGYRDLSRVSMYCHLWCIDWNDQASSVAADNHNGQTIWEHAGWTGSALWTPGGWGQVNLTDLGWNDRASSFASW
ncbi:hypothetical protein [Polymorphospora sp. NPDC050346]|uniref:hypothetical protein n=1 Tax=Polymorphospora sp. NPDC050346 TaxID=3155780 RepID=UPI0033D6DF37